MVTTDGINGSFLCTDNSLGNRAVHTITKLLLADNTYGGLNAVIDGTLPCNDGRDAKDQDRIMKVINDLHIPEITNMSLGEELDIATSAVNKTVKAIEQSGEAEANGSMPGLHFLDGGELFNRSNPPLTPMSFLRRFVHSADFQGGLLQRLKTQFDSSEVINEAKTILESNLKKYREFANLIFSKMANSNTPETPAQVA